MTVAYLHTNLSTKHEKDTATEGYIKPSKIFMMELFDKQQLTIFSPELFLFSFTFTKVPPKIFDIALNTPLSLKDKVFDVTI